MTDAERDDWIAEQAAAVIIDHNRLRGKELGPLPEREVEALPRYIEEGLVMLEAEGGVDPLEVGIGHAVGFVQVYARSRAGVLSARKQDLFRSRWLRSISRLAEGAA